MGGARHGGLFGSLSVTEIRGKSPFNSLAVSFSKGGVCLHMHGVCMVVDLCLSARPPFFLLSLFHPPASSKLPAG